MEEKRTVRIKMLRDCPQLSEQASLWFGSKWGIPVSAYRKCMEDCIRNQFGIPQWYLVLNGGGEIIAGAGVIDNDFHERKDLAPNLCALFVEEAYRGQGIARTILEHVRRDMGVMGFSKLYLVTDLVGFYERYGWKFMLTVVGDAEERLYVAPTLPPAETNW